MHLLFLGTGGYHPNNQRHTACLMVPEAGVVLDAGTAMFRVRERLETDCLDIFLTHTHLDHVVGLTYLLSTTYERPLKRVTVYAEATKLAAVERHLFSQDLFPIQPPFEREALVGPVALAGNGRLTYFPLNHPGGAVGFRLDWPNYCFAYVSDTTAHPDAAYIQHIQGVDLLVHECYFPDGFEEQAKLTGHSCLTPVAQVARQAGVGRLILVHVNPLATGSDPLRLHAAREIFWPIELAQDDQSVQLH